MKLRRPSRAAPRLHRDPHRGGRGVRAHSHMPLPNSDRQCAHVQRGEPPRSSTSTYSRRHRAGARPRARRRQRPVRGKRRARPLVAPTTVPTTDPAPRRRDGDEPASATARSSAAAVRCEGVDAVVHDPLVWARHWPDRTPRRRRMPSVSTARSRATSSRTTTRCALLQQRHASPATGRSRRTAEKYGMDGKKIYLGKVAIPTAVLALLPLNVQGNPATISERPDEGDVSARRSSCTRSARSTTTSSRRR